MPAQDISSASAVLKEVWASNDTTKQFDEGTLLLDIVEHGDQDAPGFAAQLGTYDGKYVIFPLHTAGNPNAATAVAATINVMELKVALAVMMPLQMKSHCQVPPPVIFLPRMAPGHH